MNDINKKIINFINDNEYSTTSAIASFSEHDSKYIKAEIKLSSGGKTKNEYDIWNEIRSTIYYDEFKYPNNKENTEINEKFKSVISVMKRVSSLFQNAINCIDPTNNLYNEEKEFTTNLKNDDLLKIRMIPNNEYFCVIAFETNKSITVFKINDIFDLIRIQNEINDKYTWVIKRYHDYFNK